MKFKTIAKKKKKRNIFLWIIIITFVFLFVSTCITYGLALFFKNFNFIPKVGNIHDWISFSGSILGGSITMIALIFTIMQENKNNIEIAKINIRPILFCKIRNKMKNDLIISNYKSNDLNYIRWEISNTSNNIANKIKIVQQDTFSYNNLENVNLSNDEPYDQEGISIYTVIVKDYISLPPQGIQFMKTHFVLERDEDGNFKCSDCVQLKHTIIIEYTDLLGKEIYKTKFEFDLLINIDINNQAHVSLISTSNTLLES